MERAFKRLYKSYNSISILTGDSSIELERIKELYNLYDLYIMYYLYDLYILYSILKPIFTNLTKRSLPINGMNLPINETKDTYP